jgi:hypothetical protein
MKTPLYVASEKGHYEIVKLLLEDGADRNIKYNGKKPVDVSGNNEIMKLLKNYAPSKKDDENTSIGKNSENSNAELKNNKLQEDIKKLKLDQNFGITYLNFILKEENDKECLIFALNSIQKIYKNFNSNTLNFIQYFEIDKKIKLLCKKMIQIYQNETNTYLIEQSIKFTGLLIHCLIVINDKKFENELINLLTHWNNMLNQCSRKNQVFNIRNSCIQSIKFSKMIHMFELYTITCFNIWKTCINLLQDDEDEIRSEISKFLSPIILKLQNQITFSKKDYNNNNNEMNYQKYLKFQVEYLLENCFSIMNIKFNELNLYENYLLNNLILPENENNEPILPFLNSYEKLMLYDKESDYSFGEKIFMIQLNVIHLLKLSNKNSEQFNEWCNKLLNQMNYTITQFIKNKNNTDFGLLWINDLSYESELFTLFYRFFICLYIYKEKKGTNNSEWLCLQHFVKWNEPKKIGIDRYEGRRKEIWYLIQGLLVKKSDKKKTIDYLKKQNFWGRWLPENRDDYSKLINREKFWSPAYIDTYNQDRNIWETIKNTDNKVIVSTESANGGIEDDKSGANMMYNIPCNYIFEGMKLKYSPKDGNLENVKGECIVTNSNPQSVLIRKKDLINFLDSNDLDIIWTLLGEKFSFDNNQREESYFKVPCGVYYLENGKINGEIKMFDRD